MLKRSLLRFAAWVVLGLSVATPAYGAGIVDDAHTSRHDECHSRFAVYLAASPYIINPAVADRASTTIVAVLTDPSLDTPKYVPYRLEVVDPRTGRTVFTTRADLQLADGAHAERVFSWSGVDRSGRPVPDGEYTIRVLARLFDTQAAAATASKRADAVDAPDEAAPRAEGSEITVVVDRAGRYDELFTRADKTRGDSALRSSLDPSFPYQFVYGSTHAHTRWSDGGMPVTDCQSGRYGYPGGAEPAYAYEYAKTTGELDYLAVVEHNHLMAEACSGCSSQAVLDRYVAGFQQAQTSTVPGQFVGLFGMEWGVISGGGHVNIYNTDRLMSWSGEPYHVLTPKSVYPDLYTAMKNNQGPLGCYGTFNHPNSSDFGNWTRTADGDAVMRGLSIISGPAFNTSTSFSPGGTTYKPRYDQALGLGWKIGPEAHQDNHCQNYGNSTPNRTVALIPNGTTFDQTSLLAAYNGRRIFAAQDRDVQLVYKTADGASVMGDSITASAGVPVSVSVLDPANEGVQKIEIWGGRRGTNASPGAAASIQTSNTGASSLSATLAPKPSGEEWYYYVLAVQADGDTVWSAPMWISWGASCSAPSAPSLSSPAAGATGVATSTTLSWASVSGATSYDVYFGTSATPAFYQNTTGTSLAVSGLAASTTYSWNVVARNTCGAGPASATRSFTTQAPTQVTLINEGAESGAPGWSMTVNSGSGWSIQASDPRSGTKRFKTNAAYSTYLNNADWRLTSPSFSLAGRTSATLTYWFKHDTESGYDYLRVEVSTNGGSSWQQLQQRSGLSSGWSGWAPMATLDLTPYVGSSNVMIRFRFTSDSSVTDWGVAVDDIVVTAQ